MGGVGCRLVPGQIYLRRERYSLIKDKKYLKKAYLKKSYFLSCVESNKKTFITIFPCPILSVHYWEFRPLNLSPKRTNYMSHCQKTSVLIWQKKTCHWFVETANHKFWNIKFCPCIVGSVTNIENEHWLLKKGREKNPPIFWIFYEFLYTLLKKTKINFNGLIYILQNHS